MVSGGAENYILRLTCMNGSINCIYKRNHSLYYRTVWRSFCNWMTLIVTRIVYGTKYHMIILHFATNTWYWSDYLPNTLNCIVLHNVELWNASEQWHWMHINPLNTKGRLLYLKTQFVPRINTFHLRYKNQPVYAVSGTSRCLFSDKYKTLYLKTQFVPRCKHFSSRL